MITWCEINSENLIHNAQLFKALIGEEVKMAAVVKANAYGHGMTLVAKTLDEHVDFFAVHSADEAFTLLDLGLTRPILIMGFVTRKQVRALKGPGVHLIVSTPEVIEWVAAEAPDTPLHLKVETGTNRQGFSLDEIPAIARTIGEKGLSLVGMATHFANIEDTTDHTYALMQMERFQQALSLVRDEGFHPSLRHTACSAAALLFPQTYHTMVRTGISLYGHWPSKETYLSWLTQRGGRDGLNIKPCLTWKSRVGQIKRVPQGESVGYGCTWKALRDTRLAVLPVGYSDGYDRHLSNRAHVLIGGKFAPVAGRVCMNITLVDVTDIPSVNVGDEVVLLGRQGDEEITAETLAGIAGTINYEILSRIASHIPRIAR